MSKELKAFEDALMSKQASSETYLDFLREAEERFFAAVAKEINSKQGYIKAKIGKTHTTGFLEFDGTDANDLMLSGHAQVIDVGSFNSKIVVRADSAYRGKLENEVTQKVGVLTVSLVAKMILDWVGMY